MDNRKNILKSRVLKDFSNQKLEEKELKQIVILEAKFQELALDLVDNINHNRELSTALTYLQTAKFWAVKSICMKEG